MKNDSTYFSMRMKIFCILLIFNFCFIPLSLFAADGLAYMQETTLTIEAKNKTLKEVLVTLKNTVNLFSSITIKPLI